MQNVFSGMRPTGKLHIGHYFGVLTNWVSMQSTHNCWYCIVDWHALTTHYSNPKDIQQHSLDVCIDWLAAGLDPEKSTIFMQSHVPQHAELHLALSMLTPLGWLERVPTYKEQLQKLRHLDLTTYGFLGYPLLQTADILLYQAHAVPVGADQVSHIELSREVARRFNSLYGHGKEFADQVDSLYKQLSQEQRAMLEAAIVAYSQAGNTQQGDDLLGQWQGKIADNHLQTAQTLMRMQGQQILTEPQAKLLPELSKIPGLDGQKMSKSYDNTIALRDDTDRIAKRLKTMPTDPARVRLQDPGTPEKCPVWQLHQLYTDESTKQEIHQSCTQATIGCVACKKQLAERMVAQNERFCEAAKVYEQDKAQLTTMLAQGAEKARDTASTTMRRVKQAMGIA